MDDCCIVVLVKVVGDEVNGFCVVVVLILVGCVVE